MSLNPADTGAAGGPNASVPFGEAGAADQLQRTLQQGRPRLPRPGTMGGGQAPAAPPAPAAPAQPGPSQVMTPDRVNGEVFSPRAAAQQPWHEALRSAADAGPFPNLRALADLAASRRG